MKYRLRTINAALAVILLFSALGFTPKGAVAQRSTIAPGDVAIILMNTDTPDGLAFVALADLAEGTEIRFTDDGWLSTTNAFRANEGGIKYTVPTGGIAAGTVVFEDYPFDDLGSPWSIDNTDLGSNGFSLATGGDQIIAFLGSALTPSLIYALNDEGAAVWQADATTSNESALPTGLIDGETAVAVTEVDNVKLNCTSNHTGTKDQLLEYISDNTNWIGDDGNPLAIDAGCSFTITSGEPALVINEIDYDQPSTDNAEFVELKNTGSISIDLSSYSVELINGDGGGASVAGTINLPSVTLAAGDYYVICGDAANVANCDLDVSPDTNLIQNGAPDAVGLRFNGDLVDTVSYEGDTGAPYTEFSGVGLIDDAVGYKSISRCPDGVDTDINNVDFKYTDSTPGITNYCPVDDAPSVASTVPANGAAGVAVGADIVITFSEPVAVAAGWYTISCDISGTHTAVVTGGDTVYTLNPESDFVAAESCTATIAAATVTDLDIIDPPDNMAADHVFTFTTTYCGQTYTKINEIQGSGLTSLFVGQTKTVEGVVTAYLPGMDGSYLESVPNDKDADETTSEGIFVYKLNATPGDIVRVTGSVSEYTGSYGNTALMTQLGSISNVEVCGGIGIAPTPITLPIPSDADPNAYLERYEGMLVSFEQPLTIQQNYYQGRFGQLTLGVDGRIMNPTNGTGGDYIGNIRRMVILDDGSTVQNPNPISYYPLDGALRAGDVVTELVGVMDQGRITSARSYVTEELVFPDVYYRIHPVVPPALEIHNPRPIDSPDIKGEVKIVSFNVLNYFTTLDILPYPAESPYDVDLGITPRGADSATEFTRQQDKLVAAALDIDADILGLNEIEAWDGANAVEAFTDALNTELGDTVYAYIPDPASGVGGDAIQQAIIYKPASVSPVGAALSLSATPFDLYRYPIAQLFADNASGEQFWVVVNHFKSKNCGDPNYDGDEDLGGGIGCYNATRVAMSEALLTWIDTTLSVLDPDVIVTGDLNSYGGEDPIMTLTDAGMVDQVAQHLDPLDRYTYVFDGMAGYLDHAITTPSLAEYVADAAIWHINTDEPSVIDYNLEFKNPDLYQSHEFRSSDHDPVIITLRFSEFIYYFPLIFN